MATCAALTAFSAYSRADDLSPAQFGFNIAGLSSIKTSDGEFLDKPDVALQDLKSNGKDAVNGEFDRTGPQFEVDKRVIENDYKWGKVRVTYAPGSDRLAMNVELSNTTGEPLTALKISLLQLKLPKTPPAEEMVVAAYPMQISRPDELPILLANWDPGRLAFCRDDSGSDAMAMGLQPIGDAPWMFWVSIGGEPLQPGATRRGTFSIRFGRSADPTSALTQDVSDLFAKKFPSQLNWPDRRPIGSAFLSTTQSGYANNPRGWLLDPEINTSTPQGRSDFKIKMMAYADSVIEHCKKMDAQGVLVWDIEGQEMPHATSYIADPRMLHDVAPEMDEFADEFMKKFSDAGLRTGITIRPTRVAKDPSGKGWTQVDVKDQPAEIDQKISYAEKRWGCTLFYVDSNVNFVRDPNGQVTNDPPMPAADFKTLADHHPNALLIPEHKSSAYWASTAPYSEFRLGIASTPSIVRDAYPHGFSVLRVVDGPDLKEAASIEKLSAAVKAGDILLFRPWWDDPQTDDIAHIIQVAGAAKTK